MPWSLPVVLAAPLPLLVAQAQELWRRPHYQFFPLVLAGAAYLAWEASRSAVPSSPGSRGTYRLLMGTSCGLLAAAVVLWSPWLAPIAAALTWIALLFGRGGWARVRSFLPAFALLLFAVPPPFGFDARLMGWLQSLTTLCSSPVLDLLGVYHVTLGNTVEVSDHQLFVAEACSGMQSLLPVLEATWFYLLWTGGTLPRAVWLLGVAAVTALTMNVLRVVSVAVLLEYGHVDVSEGWRHEALGFALYIITLGLIASADRLWKFPQLVLAGLGSRREVRQPAKRPRAAGPGQPSVCVAQPGWVLAAAFAVLAAVQVGIMAASQAAAATHDDTQELLGAEALPAQWGPWQRQGFEFQQSWGLLTGSPLSQTWRYRLVQHEAVVSLDYPFSEWHEVTTCYENQGWVLGQRQTTAFSLNEQPGTIVEISLRKPDQHGLLWFTCVATRNGKALPLRPPGNLVETWAAGHRLDRWPWHKPVTAGPAVRQVQLFLAGYTPPTPAEQSQGAKFFQQVCAGLFEKGRGAD